LAKTKRRLSEAERAERRQRDRERLQEAAEQLLASKGWQRWVRLCSQAALAPLCLIVLGRPLSTSPCRHARTSTTCR